MGITRTSTNAPQHIKQEKKNFMFYSSSLLSVEKGEGKKTKKKGCTELI